MHILIQSQECIPVGCVLPASVVVSPACMPPTMHALCHACPLPCTPLHHTCSHHICPLHHICPPYHACPLAIYPLPHMPPAMHTLCHTCPSPCTPLLAMHTPLHLAHLLHHACLPFAMHGPPLPCTPPSGGSSDFIVFEASHWSVWNFVIKKYEIYTWLEFWIQFRF